MTDLNELLANADLNDGDIQTLTNFLTSKQRPTKEPFTNITLTRDDVKHTAYALGKFLSHYVSNADRSPVLTTNYAKSFAPAPTSFHTNGQPDSFDAAQKFLAYYLDLKSTDVFDDVKGGAYN